MRSAVIQQFITHSAHVPITLVILEFLLGGVAYLHGVEPYLLLLAAVAQSAWLGLRAATSMNMLLGNFIGVLVYLLGVSLTSTIVLESPEHKAYIVISTLFALIQSLRVQDERFTKVLLVAENMVRVAIPLLFYAVFEARLHNIPLDITTFIDDSARRYLIIVVLLLGMLLGVADITIRKAQGELQARATKLHKLSAWSYGNDVVAAALTDEKSVALHRTYRAILFLDIRGFTAWSEHRDPEEVVSMLNAFYCTAEYCAKPYFPTKVKYTADEVMVIFADTGHALSAAKVLMKALTEALAGYNLAVGGGLHAGQVLEGMLGSSGTKAYDLIGDAANTASRLCSAAAPGELLISAAIHTPQELLKREITAKGKQDSLIVSIMEFWPTGIASGH